MFFVIHLMKNTSDTWNLFGKHVLINNQNTLSLRLLPYLPDVQRETDKTICAHFIKVNLSCQGKI